MTKPPNILMFYTDQHAARIAGCYGDGVVKTPHLDGLAAAGVTFDNAYCPSPICVPSRMAFLTGRHPYRQRCWGNSDYLASDLPTFAHALGAAGYRTILVGRLHSIGPDQLRGYRERPVGDHSANWPSRASHTLGPLGRAQVGNRISLTNSGAGQCSYELHDVDVAASACATLDDIARNRQAGDQTPFALTVGFMLPHNPYVAHPDAYAHYLGRVDTPRLGVPEHEHPYVNSWRTFTGAADATQAETMRARTAYYALVTRMDRLVGDILGRLHANGLDEETLIIYTSDHGEQLGERGLFWKSVFFDESVRIPLIMRWPSVLPTAERRSQVVNHLDLAATLLDAAGAPPLPNADGNSFLGVARDGRHPWLNLTFSEYCTDGFLTRLGGQPQYQRMVRFERWKLIYYHSYPSQLFDLQADPLEQNDLADDPAHQSIRASLTGMVLAGWNPHEIAAYMQARNADKALLNDWQERTRPASTHVWPMHGEDNWLSDPQPSRAASDSDGAVSR